MSWINDLKKWFWGELKPELQEPQFEKPKPIVPETTGKVLKEENEIHKTVEKKETVKITNIPIYYFSSFTYYFICIYS